MQTKQRDQIHLAVILFALLLAAGLTWINIEFASNTDVDDSFAPLWAGARHVITRQENPYNLAAISDYLNNEDIEASRFVYPFYGMLLFVPFGLISTFSIAKAIWMAVMMVSLLGVIFGSLSLTLWQPTGRILTAFVLFSLLGYSALRGVYTGNPALLVALFIAIGLLQVVKGRDQSAGVFMGLAILKPTMVALLLPYVFLYAVSTRNMRLIRGMLVTIALLLAAAFTAFPNWFYQNFAQVVFLYKESFPSSISAVLASWFPGFPLLTVLASVFGLWLVIEWWRSLGKDTRWFLWTSALTLALTEFIGIPTNTSNYVVLLIPLTLTFSIIDRRWKNGGAALVLVMMILILLLIWVPFLLISRADPAQPEPHFMLFPLPVLTLALLYWVRYWALSSIRLRVERLEALRRL